ncbi:serine/threonine-protein kinase [Stackebrandtia nassauensis]|uniref:non-specific serine/threonine protein kinase n=1 Tax=Stackebrandtia nassauensis (strain DSM 44728 / CIP 108903 / NRRL B-16338 / NBRC 102104 / LLR-40K-21) TaxID=446470 RepID=D3Q1V9_STANL|nr:serine/threonine-protein kinase [Stackebrandtia nassauensis]ADD41826.1 serine/threonine protein kinase with PASTA sensor(s) [Stackebrandtia nassauensis DSM 44728]
MPTPDETPIGREPTRESLPPTAIVSDRYRLDHRIGSGGMGEVWSGLDTRLERPVAVKLMHHELSGNKRFRARFASEAKLVAALDSPHVATLYDYGEEATPGGPRSYLVMEMVRGGSLADLLDTRDTLAPGETMKIIAQAAEGLQAAHDAGIIHRDVKPGNILVTGDRHVKLIDFGIARAKGEARLTKSGEAVLGTLAYTSPEQLNGDEPTPSVDVYSLGVVAYECLAGRPPFASDNPGAVLKGHLYQQPPPLPDNVPAPVAEAVMRALDKDPEQRWTSTAAFAQACRDAVEAPEPLPVKVSAPVGGPESEATTVPLGPTGPVPSSGTRRIGFGRVAAVLAAVVLLVAVAVLWRPWTYFGEAPGHDGSKEAATKDVADSSDGKSDKSSEKDKTKNSASSKSEAAEGGQSSDSGGNDSSSGGDDGNGNERVEVPDLEGRTHTEAPNVLESHGFDNYKGVAQPWNPGDQACVVTSQVPVAGAKVDPDTKINFYFKGGEGICQ